MCVRPTAVCVEPRVKRDRPVTFVELLQAYMVRWESAVRPIGTERRGTGRAFGKSCRIVLRISERLLPVMMEFQAA